MPDSQRITWLCGLPACCRRPANTACWPNRPTRPRVQRGLCVSFGLCDSCNPQQLCWVTFTSDYVSLPFSTCKVDSVVQALKRNFRNFYNGTGCSSHWSSYPLVSGGRRCGKWAGAGGTRPRHWARSTGSGREARQSHTSEKPTNEDTHWVSQNNLLHFNTRHYWHWAPNGLNMRALEQDDCQKFNYSTKLSYTYINYYTYTCFESLYYKYVIHENDHILALASLHPQNTCARALSESSTYQTPPPRFNFQVTPDLDGSLKPLPLTVSQSQERLNHGARDADVSLACAVVNHHPGWHTAADCERARTHTLYCMSSYTQSVTWTQTRSVQINRWESIRYICASKKSDKRHTI